jgi:hypothetical protein
MLKTNLNRPKEKKNMNKKQTQKLTTLVKKNTQADALYAFLEAGNEFTIEGAQAAGIADPRRVVNKLRALGVPVYHNPRTTRNGTRFMSYRIGTPRKNG